MDKDYFECARKRTSDLHQQVGALSSYFAGLVQQLIETLSRCINPSNPQRAKIVLSQLSFRQCTTAFSQIFSTSYTNQEIKDQAKKIANRLQKVSSRRNKIIHSSWIAYSTDDFKQHRAMTKVGESAGLDAPNSNPNKMIGEVVNKIYELVFDLICFEDQILNYDP